MNVTRDSYFISNRHIFEGDFSIVHIPEPDNSKTVYQNCNKKCTKIVQFSSKNSYKIARYKYVIIFVTKK